MVVGLFGGGELGRGGGVVEPGGREGGTGWGVGGPLRATADAGEIAARGGMRHMRRR